MEINWKHNEIPETPYYAVIFSLHRSDDLEGYAEMDQATIDAVQNIEGYLGYQSVYNGNRGIFISYWKTAESIDQWRKEGLHVKAKSQGKQWYKWYLSEICKVERQSYFESK